MEWIVAILVLVIDQLSKVYAAQVLSKSTLVLITGVLELTYVQNEGAAWGMFQGARIPFIVLTSAFLAVLLWFYFKNRKQMRFLSRCILLLLFAGALGNLVDRVLLGYVRDMIYVSLIQFPVFNIADSSIVIGAGLLIIETLFLKNGIFDLMEKKNKTKQQTSKEAENQKDEDIRYGA